MSSRIPEKEQFQVLEMGLTMRGKRKQFCDALWRFLCTAGFIVGSTVACIAQEKPTNWSGFYLGATGGYTWGHADSRLTNDCNVLTGIYCSQGVFNERAMAIRNGGTGRMFANGALAGLAGGVNVQSGNFVAGVEMDMSWSSAAGNRSYTGTSTAGGTIRRHGHGAAIEADWLATVRARLGYTVTRDVMIYGTVGAAFSRLEIGQSYTDDIGVLPGNIGSYLSTSHASVKTGLVLGAGAEWSIARNWSLKAEYLRIDFGSVVSKGNAYYVPQPNIIHPHAMAADLTLNIVRAGISYRF